jgi:hypothetical protein
MKKHSRRYLPVALTIAAIVCSTPAFAKHRHSAAQSSRLGYAYAADPVAPLTSRDQLSAGRAAAIEACNHEAEKYSFHTWQTMQFAVYGTCMTEHGQRLD